MLISEAYRAMQEELHREERYGAASRKFAQSVARVIAAYRPKSILDYGAGKGALKRELGKALLGLRFVEYDPARPGIAKLPNRNFQLVVCIDVLEHVEPACLPEVLKSIRSKTQRVAFLTIHTGPAGKFLSDGRNAHLIQRPIDWWLDRLRPLFRACHWQQESETTYSVICEV